MRRLPLAFVLAPLLAAQAPLDFPKGGKIVFLGDSITHQGQYVEALENLFLCAFPHFEAKFFNAGIGGDRVEHALARLDAEVIDQKPQLVTILLGMNDAGYKPRDANTLATFEQGLDTIVSRVAKETKATVCVFGPTFFDAKARKDGKLGDYNDVLLTFEQAAQRVAGAHKAKFFAPNAPMQRITSALREQDPQATLSPDSVHPDIAGGFAIASAFAAEYWREAPPVEIQITPSADGGNLHRVEVPRIPVPIHPQARKVADVERFDARYNRFKLRGIAIGSGKVRLIADGKDLGVFLAIELASGIDALQIAGAPWNERAARFLRLAGERHQLIWHRIRDKVGECKRIQAPASRAEAYAKVHAQLAAEWEKIRQIEAQMRELTRPFVTTIEVRQEPG